MLAAVWAAKRDPALRRRRAPPSALSRRIWSCEAANDEPRRISPSRRSASPTSCPGRRWSSEGVVLNKDGSFQRTARFRGPDLDSRHAGRAGRDRRPAQQRAAPARLRLGGLRRGAARSGQRAIRDSSFPDPASAPGRCRAPGAVRGGGRAFREPLLPDPRSGCRRPTMPRAPSAGSTRAASRAGADWRDALARLRRPHRPRART